VGIKRIVGHVNTSLKMRIPAGGGLFAWNRGLGAHSNPIWECALNATAKKAKPD
jgi:hypothetical protein